MDLGRLDHVLRSGLWRPIWQNGWAPMLGSAVIRYRRELRLFQRFELETRIVTWTDTTAVMEHTFFDRRRCAARGQMAARALVKAGFYDRKDRSFVTIRAADRGTRPAGGGNRKSSARRPRSRRS